MKKKTIATAFAISIAICGFSQNSSLGKFLATGKDDAQKLLEGYLSPYINAFGTSLTGGWYNTAKPHKLGGFDLTATFNTAFVPDADKLFDISELGLEALTLASGENPEAPTVAGEKEDGPQLEYDMSDYGVSNIDAFTMPEGTGVSFVPSPMLQLGIGLIKDTEINGRFMPTMKYKDSDIGMWGVGFKHGLKQYLPFIEKVPVLHVSIQYGYTQLNGNVALDVTPSDIGAQDDADQANWEDQNLKLKTKSHTANLLVSANLPVVCFYGGIGFATTKTNLTLEGDYPVADLTTGGAVVTNSSYVTNPIDMTIKNSDGSTTKPRFNVGMRLKFGVFTLHGDYTYATYSMASAGIGISFR
jgi:hypothetical protein